MDITGACVPLVCLYCVVFSVGGQKFVNVATNKTYRQISTYKEKGAASNAADGNTTGFHEQNTCSHTNETDSMVPVPAKEYHWWQVDLGRTYPVHDIIVWARTGYSDRLYPFTITVDNQTCVNVTSDPGTRSHSVTCTAVMYGQLVRLTLMKKTETLNLCELQIFVPGEVSQCKAGRYGRDCQLECGENCGGGSGRNFCYQDTGVCYDGCNGNVAGDFCTDCQAGLYGDGCNTRCGYCRVNTTCHHQDGRCPEGCVSGFTEPFCLQVKEDACKVVASVVGSVIGAAVIIVVGVVAAVCWYRRSRGGPTDKRAALQEPGRTRSANKTMDSSDHRPPSSPSPQEDTTYYEISDTANTHEMREVQNNYDALNPYSNDDAGRQPYSQLTSHASNITK